LSVDGWYGYAATPFSIAQPKPQSKFSLISFKPGLYRQTSRCFTLRFQLCALSFQLCALSFQLCALSFQFSTLSFLCPPPLVPPPGFQPTISDFPVTCGKEVWPKVRRLLMEGAADAWAADPLSSCASARSADGEPMPPASRRQNSCTKPQLLITFALRAVSPLAAQRPQRSLNKN
jgi:hypothetical protein